MKKLYSIISKNSTFKGKFNLKNSIRIEGTYHGNIRSEQEIHITKTGIAKSDLKAKTVTVEGSLIGNISAMESVYISSTGSVKGDIKSPNLKIEDGSITYGKISINENKLDEH